MVSEWPGELTCVLTGVQRWSAADAHVYRLCFSVVCIQCIGLEVVGFSGYFKQSTFAQCLLITEPAGAIEYVDLDGTGCVLVQCSV